VEMLLAVRGIKGVKDASILITGNRITFVYLLLEKEFTGNEEKLKAEIRRVLEERDPIINQFNIEISRE
jgi:hypothetical protein